MGAALALPQHLGPLCRHKHDHEGTGLSLRYANTNCVECAKGKTRAATASARLKREATRPPIAHGFRTCLGCKQLFALTEFRRNGPYKTRCPACGEAWVTAIGVRHPERADAQRVRNKLARRVLWKKTLIGGSKSSAKTRGLEHAFTEADLDALWVGQAGRCYWLGVPLQLDGGPRYPLRPSLDRLDNDLGYLPGNVVLSSFLANMGRGPCPPDSFKKVIATIAATFRDAANDPAFTNGA